MHPTQGLSNPLRGRARTATTLPRKAHHTPREEAPPPREHGTPPRQGTGPEEGQPQGHTPAVPGRPAHPGPAQHPCALCIRPVTPTEGDMHPAWGLSNPLRTLCTLYRAIHIRPMHPAQIH